MNIRNVILALSASALALCAQGLDRAALGEQIAVQVGTPASPLPLHTNAMLPFDGGGTPPHPVHVIARHPRPGCDDTSRCGTVIADEWTHNIRTSAGTTYEYNQLLGTTAAVATYIALTNTAITPAYADATLSGEIATNGLSRANGTPTNASTTLSVPAAPTLAVTGGGGGTAQFYFVEACSTANICTTSSVASASATPNATLSATAYITGTFTGQLGASSYVVLRSNSSSTPTGSLGGGSTQSSTGQAGVPSVACATSGTVVTCTFVDQSNTLAAYTVPGSNLTNYGKATDVYTWTATGAQSAQAFGIFNAASSGTMFAEGTFTPVALNSGDTLQLTWTLIF